MMLKFNPSSSQHVSALLFGGEISYVEKKQIGEIKSGPNKGNPKFKNFDVTLKLKGLTKPLKSWKTATDKISTNEAVLTEISKEESEAGAIAKIMLTIRYLEKQLSTYYNAIQELVEPFDSCVHGQLSHCGYETKDSFGGGTSTGRLSSRNPNLQNFPRGSNSSIKNYFTSRFNEGVIIEFDWKQLEVAVFAYLTQDTQLLQDIENGVDIHKELASLLYDIPINEITSEQRQKTKNSTFHVIYGGGARALAKREEIEEDTALKFITLFYRKYPMAKLWQDNLVKQVEFSKTITTKETPLGNSIEQGIYKSCTGREYYFETQDSPDFLRKKGIKTSFNPPNIKNYPVQGLATADIVLIMLGRLWRNSLIHRDKFLLINTVHDSVVVDCKKDFVDFACNFIQKELQCVNVTMKTIFNLDFNVPLLVDIKLGPSWGMLNEYTAVV